MELSFFSSFVFLNTYWYEMINTCPADKYLFKVNNIDTITIITSIFTKKEIIWTLF